MKKMMTAAAAVALAAIALSGCASQSPQERAEETAQSYMETKLGNDDKDIQGYACDGVDVFVYDEGSGYFGHGYETEVRDSVLVDTEGGEDAYWKVTVEFDKGGGMTPNVGIKVADDGSCVLSN